MGTETGDIVTVITSVRYTTINIPLYYIWPHHKYENGEVSWRQQCGRAVEGTLLS